MPEKLPMSMFCGFPVKVATLPTFAAVTSATRYGTGGSASCRVASSTTGARTRHTTSLTKNAERTPEATTTVASSASGVRPRHRAGGHHQRRADDRDAGAIDPEARDATEREPDVGRDEGRDRDRPAPLAHGHGPKHTCASENALLELRSLKR